MVADTQVSKFSLKFLLLGLLLTWACDDPLPVSSAAEPMGPAAKISKDRASGIEIDRLETHKLKVNCYLVWDAKTKKTLVIDPGESVPTILAKVRQWGLQVVGIVLTHSHYDHLGGASELQDKTDVPIFRHPRGAELDGTRIGLSLSGSDIKALADGQSIPFGEQKLTVIHTPGHAPGAVCLHHDSGVLFSGDLLFKNSVGRTDLPGSEPAKLHESLSKRLAHLPDATRVLPGHGPETNLGHERKHNPYLRSTP
jgi:hydroxyacylglutathione hydrolase